jgi:hypothetical protein
VGERSRRGGTEILFEVPHGLWVDVEPDAPRGMRQAMNRAYVAELLRRMDEAATEHHDIDHDVLSTREIELDADGVGAANEAVHEFLHRLDEVALSGPTEGSTTFTVGTLLLQMPRRDA